MSPDPIQMLNIRSVCQLLALASVCLPGIALAAFADRLATLSVEEDLTYDLLGTSVAIDDGIAVVGGQQVIRFHNFDYGDEQPSAVHLFETTSGRLLRSLHASDGVVDDAFGTSVAIDDGVVAVGASRWGVDGIGRGATFLFDAATGSQLSRLVPPGHGDFYSFGAAVALDKGTVLVGSLYNGALGDRSGSAYLFDAPTGTHLATLTPHDRTLGDGFGSSVAIDGGLALVGAPGQYASDSAPGAAYLFDVATGDQVAKLTPEDSIPIDGFGTSVALMNGLALVGSPRSNSTGPYLGAAYLFDATTGEQLVKFSPDYRTPNNSHLGGEICGCNGVLDPPIHTLGDFGTAVALDDGLALIGESLATGWHENNSPSAYVFDTATGEKLAKLKPASSDIDAFGQAVALDGGLALIGVTAEPDGEHYKGSVHLFDVLVPEPTTATLLAIAALAATRARRCPGAGRLLRW